MLKVAMSDQKQHIISGLDLGTIEKNMINKDLGILDIFGDLVIYNASGRGNDRLPHISYKTGKGEKIIYVLGYNDKARWKKALGSQSGCILIDEINVADMDYVREASIRCDYLMATLNPDDPNLTIYKEYINKSRPLNRWAKDTPEQIISELMKSESKQGWVHWFFSFKDNLGATPDKIAQIMSMAAPGTKLYKNKILGMRGRHTGLVLNYTDKNIVSMKWLIEQIEKKKIKFNVLFGGVDTSYSRKSDDKIVFFFQGITSDRRLIKIAVKTYNNTTITQANQDPIAPSDVPPLLQEFLTYWVRKFGMIDACYIDSADAATMTEVAKYKRLYGSIFEFIPSYKKVEIIDRVTLENGWLARGEVLIVSDTCQEHLDELNVYSWLENKQKPEDSNDHTVNASQYGWIPYRKNIGTVERSI